MKNDDAKFGAGFLLGWLAGRRGRRGGISVLLLLLAGFGLLSACSATVISVPLGMLRAREVRSMPQVDMTRLDTLSPGQVGLFTIRLPEDTVTDELGLALAYVEVQPTPTTGSPGNGGGSSTGGTWQRQPLGVQEIVVKAGNGRSLTLQLPPDVTFLNAERLMDPQDERVRRVGYLPGQTLTVEGTWQGDSRLTARALYAGAPDGYVAAVAQTPWQVLVWGLVCGAMSLILLLVGGVLRLLGR